MRFFPVHKSCIIIIAILFLTFCGCSGNSQLKGKVTFNDGEPVPCGTVVFSTETFEARGEIKPDGSYTVSSRGKNDGLPKGVYSVSLTGVVKFERNAPMAFPVSLCDEKYSAPETSGLQCTVPAPGNRFDIILDPHPGNYP